MKLIEKIEIKHFRSFDGGKLQPKVEIIYLNDVNIFSGANDSGKSNVLRALNLFFNNEISPGVKFNIDRDLSIVQVNRSNENVKRKRELLGEKGVRQKDLWVKIKVHFINDRGGVLPRQFFVEKAWDKNGAIGKRNSNIETRFTKENETSPSKKIEAQLTVFLDKIQFEYIPAIKDRNYFSYLFSKLQNFLFEKEGSGTNRFKESSKEFNEILTEETVNLFNEFENSSGVQAKFSVPSTLVDFFRTLSVKTENGISLSERGDGIQARFIPEILNEISTNSTKKIVWGFEEPENSYESRNIRKLRDDFINKYSESKQIFITTHSKEFLSAESDKLSIYRVFKSSNRTSQVEKFVDGKGFDKDRIEEKFWVEKKSKDIFKQRAVLRDIFDDLGIIEEARIIEDLQGKLSMQEKIINDSKLGNAEKEAIHKKLNDQIRKCLSRLDTAEKEIEEYLKPIVFLEDKYIELYKIAWLKLNDITFSVGNFEQLFKERAPFSFNCKNGSKPLNQYLDTPAVSEWNGKKVLGIFDFDDAFNGFNGLHASRWGIIQGSEASGLFRTRIDHNNFHALVLPVPGYRKSYATRQLGHDSKLEIELYFSDDTLNNLHCLVEESVAGSSPRRVFKGNKKNFWKKTLSLSKAEFENFNILFNKINELFIDN